MSRPPGFIPRAITPALRRLRAGFPVVALTGARQVGKTTLVRAEFPELPYVSLEPPDVRAEAVEDPRKFLARWPRGAILDEVQRAPDLLSYLQPLVDERPDELRFVLTGSQDFAVFQRVSQSLAGRVLSLELPAFTYREAFGDRRPPLDVVLTSGMFPPVHARGADFGAWLDSYVDTFLERDVRQVTLVRDLLRFRKFLQLCAGRTGQVLNVTRLANDADVTRVTVMEWMAILESHYVTWRLPPAVGSVRKRTIRASKLYFHDAGLAARLLGITGPEMLALHPLRGAIFETWVVSEIRKHFRNRGIRAPLGFWEPQGGRGVDLVIGREPVWSAVEIKTSVGYRPELVRGLRHWAEVFEAPEARAVLVHGAEESEPHRSPPTASFRDIESVVERILGATPG